MAGQRRAELVSLPLGPGVLSNTTPRGAKVRVNYMTWDRWNDSNWVRWHKLLAEKMGGWAYMPLLDVDANPATYEGFARGLIDWSSLDGLYWIAIGTHQKLYIVQPGNPNTLYDITPVRYVSNVSNPFQTEAGSNQVIVTDVANGAQDGDFVNISDATVVGGLELQGDYELSFIDLDTYAITAANAASSSASGGGNATLTYEITPGLGSNGELYGYGTGLYGEFEYGTPRPAGDGVFARLRSWSLDNYGEDLIASYSDGEIYWWQRPYGPNQPAILLSPDAPVNCQRVIVDVSQRVIVALGCTDVTSAYDPLLVRWCDLDDIETWIPSVTNLAGDFPLSIGSRIVTGIRSKGQNLIWTDEHLYRMVLTGGVAVYSFYGAGTTQIVGPNAAIDVDGVGYWMGFDNFYTYTGTIQLLPCEVWETVFGTQNASSLDRTQSEKVYVFALETLTEITWLYPSIGGNGECDRFVTFNWDDQVWYYGAWNRTAAQGRSQAIKGGYPYGVNGGYLYQHEVGIDAVEPTGLQAIGWYMESLDITTGGAKSEYTMGGSDARFAIGGSEAHLRVLSMVPDFASAGGYMTGDMNITLKTKDRPQQPTYIVNGPVGFTNLTEQVDIDAHGSQIRIRLDNLGNVPLDPDWSDVVLLLPCDGVQGSTDFPDLSDINNIMSANGAAQISDNNPQFGTGALALDGLTANLTCPISPGGPLDLSTCSTFTVEGWIYIASFQDAAFVLMGTNDSNGIIAALTSAGFISGFIGTNSGFVGGVAGSVAAQLGWNHLAVEVYQGNMLTWVNGQLAGTTSLTGLTVLPFSGAFYAGSGGPSFFQGQLDEMRITRNVARYTAPFTPPNLPFPVGDTPGPTLNSSFRMGIWQALAFPYAKR